MEAITYSDLRRNLKTYMDKVYNDYEPLIISKKNSENEVLLSIHEYNSLIETDYLLRNEANAAHLKKSIEQHKAGKIQKYELLQVCEILDKISHIFFNRLSNASGRVDKNRKIIEAVRPFEPRRGSTLVEQPQLFCGTAKKAA